MTGGLFTPKYENPYMVMLLCHSKHFFGGMNGILIWKSGKTFKNTKVLSSVCLAGGACIKAGMTKDDIWGRNSVAHQSYELRDAHVKTRPWVLIPTLWLKCCIYDLIFISQVMAGPPSCVTFTKGLKCWSWIPPQTMCTECVF